MLFDFFRRKNHLRYSDEQLLEAYRESDHNEALGVLYDRHLEMVFNTCNRYLENEAAAQDAVLDIFEQLCLKVRQHEIRHFGNWLHILAKNHCLMQLRKNKQQVIVSIEDFGHLHSPDETDEAQQLKEHEFAILESCLKKLPSAQNTAVSLYYLESKSYREIATLMGEDVDSVRSYIQNGRRNLRICMGSKITR